MKIYAKIMLVFLCVAVIAAAQATAFMWQSRRLLYGLGQFSDTCINEVIHSDEIQTLLNGNFVAIKDFVAAERLEAPDATGPAAAKKQAETARSEILGTLALMQEKLLLCKKLVTESIRRADAQNRSHKEHEARKLRELGNLEVELASHEASVKELVTLVDTDVAAAIELAEGSILPNLRQKLFPLVKEHRTRAHRGLKLWDQTVAEGIRSASTRVLITGLGALVIVFAVGLTLARLFAGPIRRLTQAAQAFAKGNFRWKVTKSSKDETGIPTSTVNQMPENVQPSNEALGRANKMMEKRIQRRAIQLEQSHEHLRQAQFKLVQNEKMSMLGQLAAGMAHEVNTPTAAILNASVDAGERLQELLASMARLDKLPIETRQWLTHMFGVLLSKGRICSETAFRNERRDIEKRLQEKGYDDCRRKADVILAYGVTELLDDEDMLGRLSDDTVLSILEHVLALRVSAQISEISARKIARIVRSLRVYAHNNQGQTLSMDVNESLDNTLVIMHSRIKCVANVNPLFGKDLPPVRCGAELLQVWTNILANACDAVEESCEEGMGLIEIASRLEDGKIVVGISNNGGPIPENVMEKMYDPFFTTKRVGKGMGLGLSICADILQQWGGTIRARNEDGQVTFEVFLPTMTNCQGRKKYTEEVLVGEGHRP